MIASSSIVRTVDLGSRGEHSRDGDDEDPFARDAIRAAALVVIRDGGDELIEEHGAWAEKVLLDALNAEEDVANRMRGGLNFNPLATAFVGFAKLYQRDCSPKRLRTLLEIAGRSDPAAAHGFLLAIGGLAQIDERVPKAIVRCAFVAAIRPVKEWDLGDVETVEREAAYLSRVSKAVEEEYSWITGCGPEPKWPEFEVNGARIRRRRRRGIPIVVGNRPQGLQDVDVPPPTYVADYAAALWVGALRPILDVEQRPWLRQFAGEYADFSARLNGFGLAADDELTRSPTEWNESYYGLLARVLIGLSITEIEKLALDRIVALPDESFLDITPQFLRAVDVVYFNDGLLEAVVPAIRQRLIDRLVASLGWRRLIGTRSASIEMHLGPCIATIFFNDYGLKRTECYLTPKAVERINPFIDQLAHLLGIGPSYFTAFVAMDLLEVAPNLSLLPMFLAGGKSWMASYPDDTGFWITHGIGLRFCRWVDQIRAHAPQALAVDRIERQEIDRILGTLVQLGLPEASQLERTLASA